MSPLASSRRRGFTLIELMVATSIMVVVILAVVTIASDTFKAYDRAVADLTTQSEARGVLDALENDFQTAVLRADGRCWMEVVLPGSAKAPTGAPATSGNLQSVDNPLIMLFSAPSDRPRWSPEASPRRQFKGDTCAVAYRIGQRSPFDLPGDPIQQIYGVYRTIVDPENTFNEAIPVILSSSPLAPKSPWDYWATGTHRVAEYAPVTGASGFTNKTLIDTNLSCWTLDDQNFIGANIVSMNLVFWCTSTLPAVNAVDATRVDPLKRLPGALRPVIAFDPAATDNNLKNLSTTTGGYPAAFLAGSKGTTTQQAPLRYMPTGLPTASPSSGTTVHPYEYFTGRLRIYSDRIYQDDADTKNNSSTLPLVYLPYTLRAVEVSITILTPEGSKELRGLQQLRGTPKFTDANDIKSFKRIVGQYGRNYTRYIRLLANGG